MPSVRPPAAPPAPPRNARFGPYTLVDRIAVGGMAEIFRASEPRAAGEPRIVVVKRMLPHIAAHPDARAMFEDEARFGRLVEHPNVVDVIDQGEARGHPYLTLEYVPGVDLWRLGRWLARQGRTLGVPLALRITADLLSGLHAVHQATAPDGRPLGIVHRDVSPSNVLLSLHGDVKLGDFGIAQGRLHDSLGEANLLHRAKGKLGYLSPEQVIGTDVDRRADVFSAAVIAAELLIGRALFSGDSELAILLAIRDARIDAFREAGASLPKGLADIVAAALARDPDARIPDAGSFLDRLWPYLTEPEAPLRRELGDLVVAAMGSESEATEVTPLRDMPWDVQPARRPSLSSMQAAMEGPPTGELPPLEYQVRTAGGSALGPWTYAQAVEAISTGRVGSSDRVSIAGGAFRPLEDVHELYRHLPASRVTPITEQAELPSGPDATVGLEDGGIVGALARSALGRDDGLWLCRQGSVRKEVYVQSGVPEFVTSNLAGELLGEYLVSRATISRGELDMALAVMPRFDGRLGDTLVALGLLEPVQLFRLIADQVREKLLDLFLWQSGLATFYRGVAPPKNGFPLGLDPWRLLDEGAARRIDAGLETGTFEVGRTWVRCEGWQPPHGRALPAALGDLLERARVPMVLGPPPEGSKAASDTHRAAVVLWRMGALCRADGPRSSP